MEVVAAETRKPKRAGRPAPVKPIAVTIAETKALTGLGGTKIYELLNSGELEGRTVGKRRLILYRSIEKLLGTAS